MNNWHISVRVSRVYVRHRMGFSRWIIILTTDRLGRVGRKSYRVLSAKEKLRAREGCAGEREGKPVQQVRNSGKLRRVDKAIIRLRRLARTMPFVGWGNNGVMERRATGRRERLYYATRPRDTCVYRGGGTLLLLLLLLRPFVGETAEQTVSRLDFSPRFNISPSPNKLLHVARTIIFDEILDEIFRKFRIYNNWRTIQNHRGIEGIKEGFIIRRGSWAEFVQYFVARLNIYKFEIIRESSFLFLVSLKFWQFIFLLQYSRLQLRK